MYREIENEVNESFWEDWENHEQAKDLFKRAFVFNGSPESAYDTPDASKALAKSKLIGQWIALGVYRVRQRSPSAAVS